MTKGIEVIDVCKVYGCESKEYHRITDEEHYRTGRLIKKLGGDTQKNRILDYMLVPHDAPHSIENICEGTSLSLETVKRILDGLLKQRIVINRDDGLYFMNAKNPDVKKLIGLSLDAVVENFIVGVKHELNRQK